MSVTGSGAPLVKCLAGVLHPTTERLDWVVGELARKFGAPQRLSSPWPFDRTDYYKDIAPVLYRSFVSFEGLFSAEDLAEWKLFSCGIERESGNARTVNIDPGYIDGARLVLASTKDHAHRIYLREGIFAEITLRYQRKRWISYEHTFPDFAGGLYDEFLSAVRDDWLRETERYRKREQGDG